MDSTSKNLWKQRGVNEWGYRTGGMGRFWRGVWMGAWHRQGGGDLQGRQVHRKFLCGSLSVDWQHFNRGLISIMDTGWRWGGYMKKERTQQKVKCKTSAYVHVKELSLGGSILAACQRHFISFSYLVQVLLPSFASNMKELVMVLLFRLIGPLCTMSLMSQASQAMHWSLLDP